jgi:molybdopterin-binding protein
MPEGAGRAGCQAVTFAGQTYRAQSECAKVFSAVGAVSTAAQPGRQSHLLFDQKTVTPAADRVRPDSVETIMRISARNQIKGTVLEVKKGATTSHVRVDIGHGQVITSSITNEAVDELGIKAKGHVTVVVKASDVMIAVD